MSETDKAIFNLCPTGMIPKKAKVPLIPMTPDEIAADVRRGYEAGASVVHLHARDDDEEPTWRLDRFQNICDAVVAEVPDIVVVVTTSGRNWSDFARRSEALNVSGSARPEMASLTLGSMNFPSGPSVNSPDMIEKLALAMRERGITPELEIFDAGMANYIDYLLAKDVIGGPLYANILLGSRGAADLSAANLAAITTSLPAGTTWAIAGIGRYQVRAHAMGLALGGHVRVGLEDNPYYDWSTKEATSNAQLVERAVRIAREIGREPATPDEARKIIGLPSVARASLIHKTAEL